VPEVDSACVTLVRRSTPLLGESGRQAFVRLVKQGFSQRRKMLRKLLKAVRPESEVDAALAALGLPPTVRGEELSLEQWVALTRRLGGEHV
jgi:16S rRNA (adenine1518-N6/adenine1519-N6)-dimethyltransferase